MVATMKKNKFSWGDTVRVTEDIKDPSIPKHAGSVCGLRIVEDANVAKEFSTTIGEYVYLIEFSDGYSIEVAERFLHTVH